MPGTSGHYSRLLQTTLLDLRLCIVCTAHPALFPPLVSRPSTTSTRLLSLFPLSCVPSIEVPASDFFLCQRDGSSGSRLRRMSGVWLALPRSVVPDSDSRRVGYFGNEERKALPSDTDGIVGSCAPGIVSHSRDSPDSQPLTPHGKTFCTAPYVPVFPVSPLTGVRSVTGSCWASSPYPRGVRCWRRMSRPCLPPHDTPQTDRSSVLTNRRETSEFPH